jgi:hypothetical protein
MTSNRLFGILVATGLLAGTAPVIGQHGPAPGVTRLPPDVLSLACAPTVASTAPAVALRITGGQDSTFRRIYFPGDLVTINAGTENGIEVGQQFFVRRHLPARREGLAGPSPGTIRTAGWVKVYAVDDRMSLATVTYACDTVMVDDYLEPLVLPVVPAPLAERPKAQRGNYGRVLIGVDRRRSFGKGDYLTVDRGTDHGVTLGTHFVLYRDKGVAENFLFELGEAVVMDVKPDSSTLRVTVSLDAISEGDYAAMRR